MSMYVYVCLCVCKRASKFQCNIHYSSQFSPTFTSTWSAPCILLTITHDGDSDNRSTDPTIKID